jgi:acetyl-CoA synthetase
MSGELHGEVYYPSAQIVQNANVQNADELYQWAFDHPLEFWEQRAHEYEWYSKWDKVLDDTNKPFFKWFTNAQVNIVHNALDRHQNTERKNKIAYYWEGEPGDSRAITYGELYVEVNKFANVLKSLGVVKGDRVTIYMGRIPEIVVAMLACAKLGAIHSVVFGGFSVPALAGRIDDSQSKIIVTQDGNWLNGKVIALKQIADEAVAQSPSIEKVVVVKRVGNNVAWNAERDVWYHEAMANASAECETEKLDAETPLYILYTSGTTGKPKAILHTHGGYMVGTATTLKYVFDLKEKDVWWCAADPGWVTGHSYIVYAPLVLGATSFMYEGAPMFPAPDRWWSLIDKYKVSVLYTAPTAIRAFMRQGEAFPAKHDLSSLRLLGSVGEPINPEAWRWYFKHIGHEKCPIMDTWWQTETGAFMITPVPALPLKPGSGTKPFFTYEADVVNELGESVAANEEGYLVIKRPWPSMLRTLYGDDQRYVQQYWSKYPGVYLAGDSARRDEDGYFWIIGRVDDVLNVSGHRLGTAEVESALVSHPAVAEAAVIGLPHEIKGQGIHAFVLLRAGYEESEQLEKDLIQHVANVLSPIAKPEKIYFMAKLPKTRSGKIMRRVLKARAQGLPEGDTSTLEE